MTITECKSNIDRRVTYIPSKDYNKNIREEKVIISVNNKYAIVRYGSNINFK